MFKSIRVVFLLCLFQSQPFQASADENAMAKTNPGKSMKDMKEVHPTQPKEKMDMQTMEKPKMKMTGMFDFYSMERDASGTSWQPDTTPMEGIMAMDGGWSYMLHGFATFNYNHQTVPRGEDHFFSTNMLMGMAQGPLGPGKIGFRAMTSLDPLMGPRGYSLLLQTGETADGINPLIDRQHPHDLFMELSVSYSYPFNDQIGAFLYLGYPGEPALGPPAFMHRFSGSEIPIAPLTHHWLDSTHITFGVVTGGFVLPDWKLEASAFTGREPDEKRWNFDQPRFDSASARLSFNPLDSLSLQVSYGRIISPEALEPFVNENRITASASYQLKSQDLDWGSTAAWGHKALSNGRNLDGLLVESTFKIMKKHTFFVRVERVDKNELFIAPNPLADQVFLVYQATFGYILDFPPVSNFQFGFGGLATLDFLTADLQGSYGSASPFSYLLFARVKLI